MKCVVIGAGSAGLRHAVNARQLGCEVSLVTSRQIEGFRCYRDLREAVEKEQPQFAVIASPTKRHVEELKACLDFGLSCLVEKPLAIGFNDWQEAKVRDVSTDDVRVAYCLRYHSMIQDIKKQLPAFGRIYDARLVFGRHLPLWRPERDYRKGYGAFKSQGGGVLLDSSHELDLMVYLFGPVKRLVAVFGKVSELEIESDDLSMMICEMTSGQVVQVTLDYYSQVPQREIVINGAKGSLFADQFNNICQSTLSGSVSEKKYTIERNSLFVSELDDFIHKPEHCLLPDLKEAEHVLKIFDAVRLSEKEKRWVDL